MTDILLVAVNARHRHCSFAGRSLLANLEEMAECAALLERDLDVTPLELAEAIVARRPRIAGFSVYLWNKRLVGDTALLLRRLLPGASIVVGGPEIVPGCAGEWQGLADVLVHGEGEEVFREWCRRRLRPPAAAPTRDDGGEPQWLAAPPGGVKPETLALPYERYDAVDIARRTLYVESSRGCPFRCLYCSSRRGGLRLLPLPRLLPALDKLMTRGARRFKFLDRSFNADEAHACALLDFFLARISPELRLHLEIVPLALGRELRARLAAFPRGTLHLETGVQTLDEEVARRLGRPEKRAAVLATLDFLLRETGATVHADLIFGLPGENEAGFAAGFDTLVRMGLREIQVNRLKGLPGTPLTRLPALREAFSPLPPYEILRSDRLDFAALSRLQRFALTWDRLFNRGRFPRTVPLLWRNPADSPFAAVAALAEEVRAQEGRVHALSLHTWARHLRRFLVARQGVDAETVRAALAQDGLPCPAGPADEASGGDHDAATDAGGNQQQEKAGQVP